MQQLDLFDAQPRSVKGQTRAERSQSAIVAFPSEYHVNVERMAAVLALLPEDDARLAWSAHLRDLRAARRRAGLSHAAIRVDVFRYACAVRDALWAARRQQVR